MGCLKPSALRSLRVESGQRPHIPRFVDQNTLTRSEEHSCVPQRAVKARGKIRTWLDKLEAIPRERD